MQVQIPGPRALKCPWAWIWEEEAGRGSRHGPRLGEGEARRGGELFPAPGRSAHGLGLGGARPARPGRFREVPLRFGRAQGCPWARSAHLGGAVRASDSSPGT